ncbi:hypothetical protein BDZ89DRAFT_1067355 [Hymenopellis radicata]|nr:hypothetical protein BDZ89DRAFT_1067355 [Hymenopellis radicata]
MSRSSAHRSNNRVRAPYASQACDICRRKKIRCDDQRPCAWTGELVRQPRTEAHFEALRKRIESLEAYSTLLESIVDKCREEHGAEHAHYLDLRPVNEFEIDATEDKDDATQDLVVTTENLKLEDRDLVFYGTAAPFRFADSPVHQTRRFSEIFEDPTAHYVLWIPSIPSTPPSTEIVNPSFEWSRHLPSGPLTRQEHDKILDLLFRFFTSWCLRVVPVLFLRDMYRYISAPGMHTKTPHYSPMLHNALIALATAFSDDPLINKWENRVMYAQRAKAYLEDECSQPNICVVQALSLLGSFHSSQGDQNLGYLYFGMSTKISQILGLGVDCSRMVKAGLISHDDMLDRNWAHWTTFSLDVCWSLYVGRDCSVPIPAHIEDIPVPFVDSEFDQIPFYHHTANIPPQPSYLSKTFAATCELIVVARRVMGVVNGFGSSSSGRGDIVNDELISRMDVQLNHWKSSLSPEVDLNNHSRASATPHRLMMHLLYELMFVLLHRPFFHRKQQHAGRLIDHRKLCKRAAERIMSILETWQKLYTLRYVPITLFQAVFSAGTVFLLLHRQATRSRGTSLTRNRSSSNPTAPSAYPVTLTRAPSDGAGSRPTSAHIVKVELCIGYLQEIGRSWKCALKIASILSKLLEEQVGPSSAASTPSATHTVNLNKEEVRYSPPPGPPPGYVDDFFKFDAAITVDQPAAVAGLFDTDYIQLQLEDQLKGLYPQTNGFSSSFLSASPQTLQPMQSTTDIDMLFADLPMLDSYNNQFATVQAGR